MRCQVSCFHLLSQQSGKMAEVSLDFGPASKIKTKSQWKRFRTKSAASCMYKHNAIKIPDIALAHSHILKLAGSYSLFSVCLQATQFTLFTHRVFRSMLSRISNFRFFFLLFLLVSPCSESVSKKTSGCSGSSAIMAIRPTTHTLLLDVDLN